MGFKISPYPGARELTCRQPGMVYRGAAHWQDDIDRKGQSQREGILLGPLGLSEKVPTSIHVSRAGRFRDTYSTGRA